MLRAVMKMIFMSSQNVQFSIYQMSCFILSSMSLGSLVSPLYPVTCAQPVMPGLEKCLTMYLSISSE